MIVLLFSRQARLTSSSRNPPKKFRKVLHRATTKATAFEVGSKERGTKTWTKAKQTCKVEQTQVHSLRSASFCFGLPEKRLQLQRRMTRPDLWSKAGPVRSSCYAVVSKSPYRSACSTKQQRASVTKSKCRAVRSNSVQVQGQS